MIEVKELGYEDADIVLKMVDDLLLELHEEGGTHQPLDRNKIINDWKEAGDRFTAFVIRDDNDNLMGIITLAENFAIYAEGAYGVINELYVFPDHRNNKVGKILLETAKEYGRIRGWKRIDVTAPLGEKWERTVKFYEREGFTQTGPKLKFKC